MFHPSSLACQPAHLLGLNAHHHSCLLRTHSSLCIHISLVLICLSGTCLTFSSVRRAWISIKSCLFPIFSSHVHISVSWGLRYTSIHPAVNVTASSATHRSAALHLLPCCHYLKLFPVNPVSSSICFLPSPTPGYQEEIRVSGAARLATSKPLFFLFCIVILVVTLNFLSSIFLSDVAECIQPPTFVIFTILLPSVNEVQRCYGSTKGRTLCCDDDV